MDLRFELAHEFLGLVDYTNMLTLKFPERCFDSPQVEVGIVLLMHIVIRSE